MVIEDSLNQPQVLQLVFDYENETPTYSDVEKITLNAITQGKKFLDLFEDAVCIKSVYQNEQNNPPTTQENQQADISGRYYIFKAHDAISGRNIAVKVTNPIFDDITIFNDVTKSLEWESAILAYLKNKKHIQVLTTPCTRDVIRLPAEDQIYRQEVWFIASEFLNIDINKAFFDSKTYSLQQIANKLHIFNSIIACVLAIHKNQICHRDIKPSNIRGKTVEKKCNVYLIDFESCLATNEIQEKIRLYSPEIVFSKMYASPELISGYDKIFFLAQKSDIYSLGCLLFELLDSRLYCNAFKEVNGKKGFTAINYCGIDTSLKKEEQIEYLNQNLDEYAKQIESPKLYEKSELPPIIRERLQRIVDFMTAFDYRKRASDDDLPQIRESILKIIHILEDEHLRAMYQKRKEIRKAKGRK